MRESLGKIKDKAYLDRSPEAEHATQLYRRFRDCAKGGSGRDDFRVTRLLGPHSILANLDGPFRI